MEEFVNKAEDLVGHIKEYVEVRVEEVKLEVADKSSRVMANVIARLVIFLIIWFFILLASMAIAFLLGQLWGKVWLGFLVVSVFYLLLSWLIWLGRDKWLRIPIMNGMLRQLTKKDDEDED